MDQHSLADETQFQQDLFIAHYIQHGCNIPQACAVAGVSQRTYYKWKDDPAFSGKLAFAEQYTVAELFEKARELAMRGEGDMIKFLLGALDPERFDSKYRAQILANRGTLEAAIEGNKNFTDEELRDLIVNDPAQAYVPKEPEKH